MRQHGEAPRRESTKSNMCEYAASLKARRAGATGTDDGANLVDAGTVLNGTGAY